MQSWAETLRVAQARRAPEAQRGQGDPGVQGREGVMAEDLQRPAQAAALPAAESLGPVASRKDPAGGPGAPESPRHKRSCFLHPVRSPRRVSFTVAFLRSDT